MFREAYPVQTPPDGSPDEFIDVQRATRGQRLRVAVEINEHSLRLPGQLHAVDLTEQVQEG